MKSASPPASEQPVLAGQETSTAPERRSFFTRPGIHIGIISLGIFLAALDQTVVVTALPPISTDLNIPVSQLDKAAWIVVAYLLGYTAALPLMGRVADIYGQKRLYLFSLGLFALGSLVCALSPSLAWLIGGRAVQAVGGGAVLAIGMGMCRYLFTERRVPLVLGLLGAVAEAGGVIGPLWGAIVMKGLGGALDIAGWRWIFWVNLPLAVLFAVLVSLTPGTPRSRGRVDWLGGVLLAAALLSLSLGLATPGSAGALVGLQPAAQAGGQSLITPQGIGLIALSIVFFGLFVMWQRRAADPLLPKGLFSNANLPFAAANITNLLVGAALIITMVNVPLYVASVLDGTAEQGGLMLLRMTVFIPVGAVMGGLLGQRLAYRWVAIAGLVITASGFWLMSMWTGTSADDPLTWLGMGLNGLGFGLLLSPVTATALSWGGAGRGALRRPR